MKFPITKIMCFCKGIVNFATVSTLTHLTHQHLATFEIHLGDKKQSFKIIKKVIANNFQVFSYYERKALLEINH